MTLLISISECNEPTPPTNGEVTVSVDGVVASYNCLAGYTLTGNRERFCQDDGKAWNGSDPTCGMVDVLKNFMLKLNLPHPLMEK